MKTTMIVLGVGVLSLFSCRKKDSVTCMCNGNGKSNSYDLGIQTNPSASANATRCDTLGAHDGLDSCNLLIMGY